MIVEDLFPDNVPRLPDKIEYKVNGDYFITTKYWYFPKKYIAESTASFIKTELERMNIELKIAIDNENYEDAAVIRDMIKEHKNETVSKK